MRDKIRKNPVAACLVIFAILIFVHGFEAIAVRMDESMAGENFINKVVGILVVFIVLRIMGWGWKDIGYHFYITRDGQEITLKAQGWNSLEK